MRRSDIARIFFRVGFVIWDRTLYGTSGKSLVGILHFHSLLSYLLYIFGENCSDPI